MKLTTENYSKNHFIKLKTVLDNIDLTAPKFVDSGEHFTNLRLKLEKPSLPLSHKLEPNSPLLQSYLKELRENGENLITANTGLAAVETLDTILYSIFLDRKRVYELFDSDDKRTENKLSNELQHQMTYGDNELNLRSALWNSAYYNLGVIAQTNKIVSTSYLTSQTQPTGEVDEASESDTSVVTEIISIDPFDFIHDNTFSLNDLNKGAFAGHVYDANINDFLEHKDFSYIYAEYLNTVNSLDTPAELQGLVTVSKVLVKLLPKDFGITDSSKDELIMYELLYINKVVVSITKSIETQFPYKTFSILSTSTKQLDIPLISRLEPYDFIIDYLLTNRLLELQKGYDGKYIGDTSLIDSTTLQNQIVEINKTAFDLEGQNDVRKALQSISVGTFAANNFADIELWRQALMERVGINGNILGQIAKQGNPLTSREVETTNLSALRKLKRFAVSLSQTGFKRLAELPLINVLEKNKKDLGELRIVDGTVTIDASVRIQSLLQALAVGKENLVLTPEQTVDIIQDLYDILEIDIKLDPKVLQSNIQQAQQVVAAEPQPKGGTPSV